MLQSLAMIERFIGFDTVSDRSNLPLIEFVQAHLMGLGVPVRLTFDDERRKANLLATIGPADVPGIVLSGHTDVVPVADQAWTSDPFRLTRRDDRLVGRGVADMKGFLAIATAFAADLAARPLRMPIHLAMSYDEEVGCLGVPRLIEDMLAALPRPRWAIVGEPSGMDLIVAHKGKIGCHVEVQGRAAHSGVAHLGANAAEAAAEAIAFLKGIARLLREAGPFDPRFDAPPHTTIQTCRVEGGTAVNIVPSRCAFDFDIRFLPGEDPQSYIAALREHVETRILPEMRAVAPEAAFAWTVVPGCEPLATDEDAPVVDLAARLAGSRSLSRVGFGTEAGHFQKAGIETVICGPGSIREAHKPDEYLTLDQVARCEQFMARLAAELS